MTLQLPVPKVYIDKKVYSKISHWVSKGGSHECSGMGKVKVDGEKIVIVDAWMVKQKNSGAETEMDGDDLAKMMFQKREVEGTWSFWWHSHANMDTFWSGTDRDQIAKLAANGFCVATVFNTAGKTLTCVASNNPFPFHIDGVELVIDDPMNSDMVKSWDAEYDDKVSKSNYTVGPRSYYGSLYEDEYWDDYNKRSGFPNPRGSVSTQSSWESRWGNGQTLLGSDKEAAKEVKEEPKIAETSAIDSRLDAIKRAKEIYEEIDILEKALQTGTVTKRVCALINVRHFEGIEMGTDVEGFRHTVEDEVEEALLFAEEELEIILTSLRKQEEQNNGTDKPTHKQTN
jgi:proteasome lid subunit RPN8/RPN11